ncbi:MAG TPA: ABC transporter ATP-binding protein [Acidimicrobiia bacterium]|nr:ABC transporter ATP-binding protein [Acidimicrobiia bacterium]
MIPLLDVRGVRKSYGRTVALDGVDLTVGEGTILGLLGPNGAGKTSLVSIVAGLRRPDAGTVRVAGIDVTREAPRARSIIGYAPQDTGVYSSLGVRENVRFFAALAGLRRGELRARVDAILHALGLDELSERRASQLSGGERRRLHTAIALVHRPRLVLLDEPTTGADVRTRAEILTLVRALADDGSAVVYSTHYLHEIEELGASVAFIDRGRVVAQGDVARLVAHHGTTALELTFDGDVPHILRADGALVDGSVARIPTDDPAATAAHMLRELGSAAGSLRGIEVIRPSLESVFLSITGRRYESAEHAA